MENPIRERNRTETRQTVETITASTKRKKDHKHKQKQDELRSNACKLQNKQTEKDSVGQYDSKQSWKKENTRSFSNFRQEIFHHVDLLGELTTEDS